MKKYTYFIILVLIGAWIVPTQAIFAQKDNLISKEEFILEAKNNTQGAIELTWKQFEADEFIIFRNDIFFAKPRGKNLTYFIDTYSLPYHENTYKIVATRKANGERPEKIYTAISKNISRKANIKNAEKYLCYPNQTIQLYVHEVKGANYQWFKDRTPESQALNLPIFYAKKSGEYHVEVDFEDRKYIIEPVKIEAGKKIGMEIRVICNALNRNPRFEATKKEGVRYFWLSFADGQAMSNELVEGERYEAPAEAEEVTVSARMEGEDVCGEHKTFKVIDYLKKESNFSPIYPNPFNENFILRLPEEVKGLIKLSISNLQGEIICQFEENINNETFEKEINLKEQPKGIYFLQIQTDKNTWTEKLIKN